ncbi:hypothetical protein NVP2275O_040 [Vibrio phage 2.275.O._10N.286.54.E11]|nr:hypothetical protein NVP2275O_040 [Vibrio phage 2.275.O._10N.286.54.E11]
MATYKEPTAKAQMGCFIEFAKDVLSSGVIYENADQIYLQGQVKAIEDSLRNYPHKAHNDTSKISSLWEEILSACMKRHNPFMVTAEELELKNLAGTDIIPNLGHPKRDAVIAHGILGVEAKVCTFSQDASSDLYTGAINDVDKKFTSLMILLLDPNFAGKKYRIIRMSTEQNRTKNLSFNIGSVSENKHKKLEFTSTPMDNWKGGVDLDVRDLASYYKDYSEFDLLTLREIIVENRANKNGKKFLENLFSTVVEATYIKDTRTVESCRKLYPKNPHAKMWDDHAKKGSKITATGVGFKKFP